jgi:hypothetical protein
VALDSQLHVERALGKKGSIAKQISEERSREGSWPTVIAHGHIGEESSTGASTRIFGVARGARKDYAGNLILRVTSKGSVCHFFRVYWRPEEPIRLSV